jgi:hypothetical protein
LSASIKLRIVLLAVFATWACREGSALPRADGSSEVDPDGSAALPRADGSSAADTGPCDASHLELSGPHGRVLSTSRVILRWRPLESGPYEVKVLDPKGQTVYSATTFGWEMRVLVSRGPGAMGGPHPPELEPGKTYRWTVQPRFVTDPTECPVAEFRILSPEDSKAAEARLQAAARKLGVGNEETEPEPEIALAKMYVEQGFYAEAERDLRRLRERGWDDKRITAMLAEIYRKTGRHLSLRELETEAAPSTPQPARDLRSNP